MSEDDLEKIVDLVCDRLIPILSPKDEYRNGEPFRLVTEKYVENRLELDRRTIRKWFRAFESPKTKGLPRYYNWHDILKVAEREGMLVPPPGPKIIY